MNARLKGRTALVTGAAGGIGAATVVRLHDEGAIVWATDLPDRVTSIPKQGAVAATALDVTDEEQWNALAKDITAKGGLDILVNCAGSSTKDVIEKPTDVAFDAWERAFRVNADGCFFGMRSMWPLLLQSGKAAVVNVSSLASMGGTPFDPAYGAAKAAVWQLSRTYAEAGAGLSPPIRVNTVHPGIIWTDMWEQHARRLAEAQGASVDAIREQALQAVPMGRAGGAEEVASAIAFLSSDDASYITGQALVIDGGITA